MLLTEAPSSRRDRHIHTYSYYSYITNGVNTATTKSTTTVLRAANNPSPNNKQTAATSDNNSSDNNNNLEYKTALTRTLQTILLSLSFAFAMPTITGSSSSTLEFLAGYLLELSLSIDNLLVFVLLFSYFDIPRNLQGKVLDYGIYGAVFFRAVMIAIGAVALENFKPILLVFAAVLVFSSGKILTEFVDSFFGEDDGEEVRGGKKRLFVLFPLRMLNLMP